MVQAVRRSGDGGDRERMDRMRVRLRTTTVGRLLILCGLIAELVAAPFALAGPRVAVAARAAAVQPSTPLTSGPVPVTATTTMTATTAAPTATATLSTGAPAALGSMSSTPGASVTATGLPAITGTVPATATTTIAAPTAPTLTASLSTTTTATAVLTAGAALTSTVSPTATATVSDTAPATLSVPSTDTIASPARPADAPVARLLSAALPLSFEENRGQTDPTVTYLAHGPGYTLFLTADETVLTLSHPRTPGQRRHAAHGPDQATTEAVTGTVGTTLRLRYAGANAHPQVDATDQLPGLINYFIGSNPADWQTDVPTFSHVTYHDVYPGTDLVYYGTAGRLEYDWRLQPGADPGAIGFSVEGARGLRLDGAGALSIDTPGGALRQHAPVAYQEIDGRKRPVASRYVVTGADRIGFALGAYDKSKPVTIDPVLSYSTYLGGGYTDEGYGIAVDSAGSAYITGQTNSPYFPTKNSIQGPNGGSPNPHSLTYDAFVTKLNPAGNALVYSTYLGGQNNDYGRGIAVGGQGAAYVTGFTGSPSFPTTSNAYQTVFGGYSYDAFVTKLNPAGNGLLYSSFLGGANTDYGYGIADGQNGTVYVVGTTLSANFPITNAYQSALTGGAAFLARIDTTASGAASLRYSTYLGSGSDGLAIAADPSGSGAVYVTGDTVGGFPVQGATPIQGSYGGGSSDAYVAKLNTGASGAASLLYSTYLGGSSTDVGQGIAADAAGDAYVTGYTGSSNFPTKNALQGSYNGGSGGDAFVAKVNPAGAALVYSTYLGGSADDRGNGIAADAQGNAYVTGYTNSTNFPVRNAPQPSVSGSAYDAFVAKLNAAGSLLPYSTYLGGSGGDDIGTGIAVDAQGSAYVTGYTAATDFPTTNNALQGGYGGGDNDAFVAEIGTPSGMVPWHPHSTGGGLGAIGGGVDLSVDLADGHADIGLSGMSLPARGPDLTVNRTWDSSLAGAGANPLASSLTPRMGGVLTATVSYTDGSGSVWPFLYTGSPTAAPPYSAYRTPLGQPWQLTASPSGYTLTNVLTGEVWTFDGQGRLLSETDAYGNTNSYSYGAGSATSPSNESNSGGRAVQLGYSNGQLSDAQSPLWASSGGTQGQHVTYGYTGGQLTSMTRGAGTAAAQTTTYGYSGAQLTSITTAANRTWAIGYDAGGRVSGVTSPASGTAGQPGYTPAYTTQYNYNPGRTVVVEGAGTGAALAMTYTLDAAGEATSVTDGLGHTSHSAYDANHDVLTSSDANNNTTTNKYQYIGPNGAVGQIIEEDQPAIQPYVPGNGATVTPVITHTYDATTHDLVATKLPEGGLTTYTYDGHHAVVGTAAQTTCPGCGVSWQGTINQYDPYGERTSTTDGRGVNATNGTPTLNGQAGAYTSHMGYDAQGDLTSASTPPLTATLGGVTRTATAVTTSYTYDGDGNRQTLVSANGNTTSYGYDHLGRQTALTLPTITLYNNTTTAPVQTTSYDADGNVARETDGKGDTTLSSYDPMGRLVAQTNPVSGTLFSVYNATELASQRDPQGNVTAYSYDADGRAIGQADPLTGTVQYGYDAAGNTTAMTLGDASGGVARVETMGYDALDRVTTDTVTAPTTGTVTTLTAYDQDGNVAQTQQPNGDVTYNTYDAADRLRTVEIDPQPVGKGGANPNKYETYTYDAAGNVAQSTDADNRTTTTQYDGDNRPVQSVDTSAGPSGVTTITTASGYDPNGNTVSRTTTTQKPDWTSETHTATSAYNAADQPTGTSDDGLATSYGYDAADQIRTETTSDGTTNVTNGLDAAGRITSVAEGAGGAGPYSSQFGYNADSLPSTIALPRGVSEHASYDANSNLTGLTVAGPSMGTITNTLSTTYGYAYNGQGLATSETTISGTDTVTHDPATGRVTADCGPQVIATTPDHCYHWSYDANGNVTSGTADNGVAVASTFSASAPNELQKIMGPAGSSPTSYAYDGNGDTTEISNTIAVTAPTSKDALDTRLTYDAQARPVTISKGGAQPLSIALGYDAEGRRARYTVTVSGTVTVDERFGYRGGALGSVSVVTATLNGDGSVKARGGYNDTYITGPQGEPLEFVRVAGGATNRYFYVLDGHGSVVAVTDASGKVVDRYNYDVWGEPIGQDYQTVQQQVRYAGYWWDGEVQWYWLAGRSYDPEAQRFLQPDPTDLDGVRTYVYANDDPIDLIEVGGAFSISGFFHHAVQFLDSAAHVTFKVAEAAWNAVAGDDIHTICCTSYPVPIKALAVLDLALTVVPGADAAKLLEVGVKGAAKAGGEQAAFALVRWIAGKTDGKVAADLSDNVLRDAFRARKTGGSSALRDAERVAGCALCFPAGTLVTTAHGEQAIQTLHVGDVVQAENPATGKVEAEAVQAVIQDPVSPLIAVDLSDGSAITVTADHPFWVDAGAQLAGAGWFAAGRLQAGDELRMATGAHVMVVGLRRNVGSAVVYTLTVAKDHTFFVGAARVLVHNCDVEVFATKTAARQALSGDLQIAANRFFRDAAANSRDFTVTHLNNTGYRFEFFSPARNAGYGKRYVQEVDSAGRIVREYKDTLGPEGLIERKWLHGETMPNE